MTDAVRDLSRRPKISQIGSRGIPGHRGGVERVVEAVAPRLVAGGLDVTVYCAPWSEYKDTTYKGVRLTYINGLQTKHLDTISRSFVATLKEMFGDSDIVHYHGSGSAPLALLARIAGKRVVVTIHGLDWQRRKWGPVGRWFLQFGERAALRLPHRTVVVGPDLKAALDSQYGVNVDYIPNGVEDRLPRAPMKIRQLGLGHRDYILYLARIVPEKQAHTLIKAWRAIVDRKNMKLVIAGPTWHSKDYVASLREMATGDDSIIFTGEVEENVLEELYSNCYIYVLPSEVEGMSLSLLDGMAYGACIVTSDIPANAYVVGDAGITFRVGDTDDLRAVLEQIIKSPESADALRRAAKQRMTQEFHWDAVVRRWERLYRDILR